MSHRPAPTWSLVEPPPAVEIAADLLGLAVAALEAPTEASTVKERRRLERRQLGVGHAAARAIDWTAMEWFYVEGGLEVASHAAQCVLRLTWDHVTPRSAGGSNTEDNIVASCGTCNFSKSSCTIEELSLRHPLDRDPLPAGGWDALSGRLGARPI